MKNRTIAIIMVAAAFGGDFSLPASAQSSIGGSQKANSPCRPGEANSPWRPGEANFPSAEADSRRWPDEANRTRRRGQ